MARGLFEEAYLSLPPWDIGRPQGEIIRLAEKGQIRGAVLDAGCGTGENALFLANQGYEVTGIDAVEAAIRKAKEKSRERRVPAVFLEWDALEISGLGKRFDTVIDCGLFHVFSDEERPLYVQELSSILVPGGTFRMLCFSEMESGDWGPRRVTQRRFGRPSTEAGRWTRSGKRFSRQTWGRKGAGRGSRRSHGNERRRIRHGSHRGVQRRGDRHCDHLLALKRKIPRKEKRR